ncbi:MAG TPA: response regulator [Terriglobales bacterium]|nr:response regulator [Terriglobales bacterium]
MGGRILVVDDDLALLELLIVYLGAEGYEVTPADNASAALRVIEKQKIAAVITDALPGFGALKIIKSFRERNLLGPAILFTGFIEDEISEKALAAGATMVLFKPADLKEISSVLKRLLARTA